MRFSIDGPDIPDDLIESSIRGEVVFLCGAGVSRSSGLPDFKVLTNRIFVRLGEDMAPAERQPFNKGRFEETLGALARRLADKRRLYSAVAEELNANAVFDLSPHETILRLSRDFESRPVVVTTNFDTLFERALNNELGQPVRSLSFAGAQAPAPAGPRFEGIIHLHGRLADHELTLDGSDLVLTSADYGDAYLRSGWASRFLFDLARTRTIVLVGYSASDPPVRYILNILEADRERFPDIKPVYALDAHKSDNSEDVLAEWEAVAVEQIPYEVVGDDYSPFWRDLAAWADLSETPRAWRKSRLEALAVVSFDQLREWEHDQVAWIFGHEDAIELLPKIEFSPAWLEFLRTTKALKPTNAAEWSLAQWAAKRLHAEDAFREIHKLSDKLGPAAAGIIDRALTAQQDEKIPPNLEKAWRLLTIVVRAKRNNDHWHRSIALNRIRANQATTADLAEAIEHYVPRLRLHEPYSFDTDQGPDSLSGLCRVELEADENSDINEFLNALQPGSRHLWPALQIASGALLQSLGLAIDAELAGAATENASVDVPSISAHEQNKHRGGFLFLTRVCAELWLKVHAAESDRAYAIGGLWKQAGFALTTRLWLFTLHERETWPPSEIVQELLLLPLDEFWEHRKEIMELLRDRCSGASLERINQLADRILAGPEFHNDASVADKQRGLDTYRWLYLKALIVGYVEIPPVARTEFERICKRRSWEARELKDEDFFWTYSFGLRHGPIGDPAPIVEADTTKRIDIATDLEHRDSFNQSDVWRIYCKQDPAGALAAVIAADADAHQAERWRDVLWSIQEIDGSTDESKAQGRALSEKAFAHLQNCENLELASPLVGLYCYALTIMAPIPDPWWDRLWRLSTTEESNIAEIAADKDPGYVLISRAVNTPAGKLAKLVINRLGPKWRELSNIDREQTQSRLDTAIGCATLGGACARAEITRYVAWLDASLPRLVDGALLPRLEADTLEGEALRSILVGMSPSVGKDLRAKLKGPILRGVKEHRGSSVTAENAASRLVAYVHDDLTRDEHDPLRLRAGEAKSVLNASRAAVLAACAEVIANSLSMKDETPPHEKWRQEFSNIFDAVWPAGKKQQTRRASISLAKLAMASDDAFPEALKAIKPYIVPIEEDWPHLYFATTPQAHSLIGRYPRETLELLWALLRPATRGQSHQLAQALDLIAAAAPALVRDRRFQLLETRAMRLD